MMTHLYVELYDRPHAQFPCYTLDDHDVNQRQYFHNLTHHESADRAVRVVIKPGDEYRTGDHIRLMREIGCPHTDTVAIDPIIADDVDLNQLYYEAQAIENRTAGVLIVTSPNPDSGYRLRVSLYKDADQRLPSLLFYDWEYPSRTRPLDLNRFHFAHKAAVITIEPGPNYEAGDRVLLREGLGGASRIHALEPGTYNLHQLMPERKAAAAMPLIRTRRNWAELLAGLEFELQPRVVIR
ncbi:MAG TPA: hypothetical protein P5526_10465 [Anaerolineae bacterium]|nr:hypothetical protein [Anaerolineales bacterium]HRV92574.1 hypothetical protein [Anaerolineae bacterium]